MANKVFERFEKKYLLEKDKYDTFISEISPYMKDDFFPEYLVANIYLDTSNSDVIRHSVEKPVYKEKLRVRSYGVPLLDDDVFLEVKRKVDKRGSKRRISLNLQQLNNYFSVGKCPEGKGQIMKELDYIIKTQHLAPKIFISYKRRAFISKDDANLRVTVDTEILSRETDLELQYGNFGTKFFDTEKYLIEIKTMYSFPLWLSEILTRNAIYPVSFSKYGRIFQKSISDKQHTYIQN